MLIWIERVLIAVGVALAAWCAVVLVEARFTRSLPPEQPPLKVTMTLPGEDENGAAKPRVQRSALKPGAVIGTLTAPRLQLSTPVLEGSDDGTLRKGAGHIEDTPYPGEDGNVGIAGHRDTVFRPLERAKVGDALELVTADRTYRYEITRTLITNPTNVEVLDPTGEPMLTLVTCYPFVYVGHAPRRFIVQAKLMEDQKRGAK